MNWRAIFKPSAKYSIFALLAVGIIVGVVGYFTTQQVLHATSTDEFCMSCHSNHSLKDEVLASVHGGGKSGIVVECQQCHVAQDPFGYLKKKIIVSKDVIGYLTIDGFNTQEWLEENRAEQAELAARYFRQIDSSTCQNCHNRIYEDQPETMKKMAVKMHTRNFEAKGTEKYKTCIDCHQGVAHPFPREGKSPKFRAAK
ncbi:NapC/NirT family cytochrome c [Paraferrimonas sedimenticola]|uniref:Cytochrome c-type protein n=1 Tax=Paraferrimonas sedimenticola TaxID=375674 RepID=A0AA37VVD8_9GAMM|nr:NapC/NirT family cytochrome c [Paraferrimonas sedimenticola]GLP95996.1 cytochrome c-type protein [Paraferrimonas sedimenticola]